MIDSATVQRIMDAADIVEVVGDYVHLIRSGANYKGLCPFHNERTPSFSVNKSRNFCYCFSCKKGGSPVNFIMEKEGLSYYEALLHLAKKYGIEVHERELTDEERQRMSERESMFVANEWAMRKMERDLTETEEGRDIGLQYFTQRGVTDAAIKAFHLGYAIDKYSYLIDSARREGLDINVLKKLGLVGTSQQGKDYDRFRGRVIFPILNPAGKTIAFGGRDLKGGNAKYINSPESDLYKKSNELYGMFQAKGTIVRENKCYLVEGYMDVIGMWQSGMKNVVASSGTALTDGQIAMIHRFTENITLIYDGDAAGIKASLRGIDMLLSHRLNVKVLLLPDGDDPDSFARKNTPEEFKKYVDEHETDIIRFKAQVLLDEVKNDPHSRINAVNSVVNSIAHIPDQVARDIYIQECAIILSMPEETISKAVAKARGEVTQKLKHEREIRNINRLQNSSTASKTTVTPQSASNDTTDASGATAHNTTSVAPQMSTTVTPAEEQYPLYPLELAVIKYCVRYAFLNFCVYEDENKQKYEMRVIDYVTEELEVDNMSFSVPAFGKIFNLLKGMTANFDKYLAERTIILDNDIERRRSEGYKNIAENDLSVSEIRRAEKKMEEDLANYRKHAIIELTKDYPGRILGSHEDDEIRKLALELIFEKHHLSNIYLKDPSTELEEDRLNVLVVRSLVEWRNELINQRLKQLFNKLSQISGKGNAEEEQAVQIEINKMMRMRTEAAKQIGDRIIYNPSKKLFS